MKCEFRMRQGHTPAHWTWVGLGVAREDHIRIAPVDVFNDQAIDGVEYVVNVADLMPMDAEAADLIRAAQCAKVLINSKRLED